MARGQEGRISELGKVFERKLKGYARLLAMGQEGRISELEKIFERNLKS